MAVKEEIEQIWPPLIAQYRKRHGLTQNSFADRFAVTQQTVSRWEAGLQTPNLGVQSALRSVVGLTGLGDTRAWIARVNESFGMEALLDASGRILAVSRRLLSGTDAEASAIVGKKLDELPGFGDVAPVFARVPLFSGALRGLKVRAQIFLPKVCMTRDVDLWPVLTTDDQLVAHVVAYEVETANVESAFVGVRLVSVQGISTDGSVVEMSAEAPAI